MALANLSAGWIAILAGLFAGAIIGMFFHDDEWLGGYGCWRRRMLRLGHISMVGTGLLNLAFAVSVAHLKMDHAPALASILLIAGAVAMPSVCLLSAWRKEFRHLFFIPVGCLIVAAVDFIYRGSLL
ncbi:MAG: hypothetical protein HQ567_20020 [Candidatus Nealsonbacteria bacterium]|nr:hypothetical protein [Candidatus Nealsonbacteria bacterium]